jgi:hypothetical protein
MGEFKSPLMVKYQSDSSWLLVDDFIFKSRLCEFPIVVPAGFETDFASVPRIPLAYLLAGDCAHEAAVIHDYLYRTGKADRKTADEVFLEAMEAQGIGAWRRYGMYWAVRLFGGSAYKGAK